MAELLNSEGVVVKTKEEGFATWLLKLYVLSCRAVSLELSTEYQTLFRDIFASLSEKLEKQKRLSGSQLAILY